MDTATGNFGQFGASQKLGHGFHLPFRTQKDWFGTGAL